MKTDSKSGSRATVREAATNVRSLRRVLDLIRGRGVNEAYAILKSSNQAATRPIEKTLRAAVANATQAADAQGSVVDVDELVVKEAFAVERPRLKRFSPRAVGWGTPVIKRTAELTIVVDREPAAAAAATPRPEQLAAMADYHRARRGFATDAELADVLGVHRTRLAEWKQGAATPTAENARLLSHMAVTVGELEEFLDPDVIPDWFLSEQHTLGGRTPAEALRQGRLAEVLFAANATEHGAYV